MTNTESTTDHKIIAYVSAVSARLAGIPEDERTEILEDLRDHLREVSKENSDKTLEEIVGAPSAYAEELLASSGVAVGDSPKAPRSDRIAKRAEAFFDRLPFASYLRDLLPVLQPSWWVLRAYLFAAVALTVFSVVFGLFNDLLPFPRSFGSLIVVLFLTALLIPSSVAVGRKKLTGNARPAMWLLNGLLVFIFLVAANHDRYYGGSNVQYVSSGPTALTAPGGGQCLTDSSGNAITNLFAYDSDGVLIPQVLLFDQSGRALDNLCPDNNANGDPLRNEYAKDANGAPVYNAFPRKQWVTPYSDTMNGAIQTEKPVLPPAIVTPKVVETTTTTAAPVTTTTVAAAETTTTASS